MLSRQSRSSGAPLQPLPPPGHVFVQSARSTTVGRAARVMPALAPARAAALARADAPRRELPVLGAKQKLDAAPAPAPKRGRRSGTLEDDWRNRASPSQIASDLAALCERGCRCGCAKKYFAGPENLTADATRTRALLKGYDQQQRREYLRTYLQNHRCREKGGSWKFSFSLDDASKPCCLSTFAARTGFRKDQIYKLQAELKAGIVADAVAGGNRRGGGDGDDVDTLQARQCFGYCKKLEQEAEPMPNSTQLQLDDISNGELYEEFRALELTAGTPEAQIASEDTLMRIFREQFPHLKIRVWKSVDGKDLVRAGLRELFRRTSSKRIRREICELRGAYRATMRVERCFYWHARNLAALEPEVHFSMILDGATQDYCQLPRLAGTDVGRDCCKMKLVGVLAHGRCLTLFLVHPHVKADANLHLTTLDIGLQHAAAARGGRIAPNWHIQVDGDSGNWCKAAFAHVENLVATKKIASVKYARNPVRFDAFVSGARPSFAQVGNTHEDIDALFALVSKYVEKRDILEPAAFKAAVEAAFANYALPVHVVCLDAALDYTGFYAPNIYPKLAGFGYSSETKGMHVYESRSVRDGVGAASTFKRHNQDNFVTVAVSPDDTILPHDARPKPGEEFTPRLVSVDCRARHHADILVSLPSGSPGLAAPDPRFAGYDKVKRDVLHVLAAHELNRDTRERWMAWCDSREAAMKRHPFAQFGGVWSVGARTPTAREAVAGNLVRYVPPNPIVSTRNDGAEARRDRQRRNAAAENTANAPFQEGSTVVSFYCDDREVLRYAFGDVEEARRGVVRRCARDVVLPRRSRPRARSRFWSPGACPSRPWPSPNSTPHTN